MKKLLFLFLAAVTLSCSKDDSTEPQTFFEKYDGVVWEESHPYDYVNRIQINNGNSVYVNQFFQEEDYIDCSTELLENSGELLEVNENSFVMYVEYFEGDTDYSYTITISATDGGSNLTLVDSDIPNEPAVFNRTSLSQPCD